MPLKMRTGGLSEPENPTSGLPARLGSSPRITMTTVRWGTDAADWGSDGVPEEIAPPGGPPVGAHAATSMYRTSSDPTYRARFMAHLFPSREPVFGSSASYPRPALAAI